MLQSPPTWVAADTVKNCFICKAPFTFWNRKHHCRSCGRVFCNACSSSWVPLPQYGLTEPQRVCDICAKDDKLCKADSSAAAKGRTELTHDELIKHWLMICIKPSYQDELHDKIYHGVPNALRPMVWTTLAEVPEIIMKNQGVYKTLCEKENAEIDSSLQWDIPRTFPNHPMFQSGSEGQKMLANVLRAYANFKGYTQSMSYIVATLLLYLEEESAFWTFVQITKKYRLEPLMAHDVPECIRQYSAFLARALPHLNKHLHLQGVSIEIFAAQWLQTLFAQLFDLTIVARLWDIFFVEGFPFLLKVPLALLHHNCERLLSMQGTELLFFFKSLPQLVVDPDALITRARAVVIDSTPLISMFAIETPTQPSK